MKQIARLLVPLTTISTHISSVEKELSQLDQSILAKAFRGELVPQDLADEPASVLLERIRREREASTNGTTATPKKRRTKSQ